MDIILEYAIESPGFVVQRTLTYSAWTFRLSSPEAISQKHIDSGSKIIGLGLTGSLNYLPLQEIGLDVYKSHVSYRCSLTNPEALKSQCQRQSCPHFHTLLITIKEMKHVVRRIKGGGGKFYKYWFLSFFLISLWFFCAKSKTRFHKVCPCNYW